MYLTIQTQTQSLASLPAPGMTPESHKLRIIVYVATRPSPMVNE